MNPLLSVITVVFNGEKDLETTLQTLWCQTFLDYELLVIDGDSTDGTLQIIEKNKSHINYFVSEKDEGLYHAMNKGIAAARGKFLYFLNVGDELFDRQTLQNVFADEQNLKAHLIYGKTITKQNPLGADYVFGKQISIKNFYFTSAPICHQSSFIQKKCFDQLGGFDLRYRIFADQDWFIRCFLQPHFKIVFLDRVISRFQVEGVSFHSRISGFRESMDSGSRHFPPHIVWIKKILFLFILTKKYTINLLINTTIYKVYTRLKKNLR